MRDRLAAISNFQNRRLHIGAGIEYAACRPLAAAQNTGALLTACGNEFFDIIAVMKT